MHPRRVSGGPAQFIGVPMATTRRQHGFTLIEILIVVAIIGILAAIAIPNFLKFQAKAKQAEPNAQLKAIFSAQKTNFPLLHGYWSDINAIGFAPERGNRYVYDLGATAATVLAGMEGPCASLADRSGAGAGYVPPAGTCGVEADVDRHGSSFDAAILRALPAAAPSMFVPNNTNTPLANVGVNGADCPSCDFAASAISNIDNDQAGDSWWISSQIIESPAVPGCGPAMTIALNTAYTTGTPAAVNDDSCQ